MNLSDDGKLRKQVLSQGYGATPSDGMTVEVHYIGRLENGTIFDSSLAKARTYKFLLGSGQVIRGWEIAFKSMQRGEKSFIQCHADYAYGSRGKGSIPPNATITFEAELLNFKTEAVDNSMPPVTAPTTAVTTYFSYFYKDYAKSYGDQYCSACIRSFAITKKPSALLFCLPTKFTVYKIEVLRGERSWVVKRRYNDFLGLLQQSSFTFTAFPPKSSVFVDNFATSLLQQRTDKLNAFLQSYLESESKNKTLSNNKRLLEFLELL